jgi:carboxymethylenebutenolidase
MQVYRMFTIRLGLLRTLAVILAGHLVLAACDKSTPRDEAEVAAGRENVEAMSREHADDTTDPSPAATMAPASPVVSDPRLPYAEAGNELVYGYFAAPSDVIEPAPALIVIHEWWGLNDNVRAMADRLAGEGYMVLAVDLFNGEVADSPAAARELMLRVVEDPELAKSNLRDAYAFLEKAGAPRIGSLGWCFGGGWSLTAAQLFPDDLDASVIYYGRVTADEEALGPINAPILGLFGAEDSGIRVSAVEAFGDALDRLRKDNEIHIYPGAGHAFANPTGRNYNAEAAEDAWAKTVDFLSRHLSDEDADST